MKATRSGLLSNLNSESQNREVIQMLMATKGMTDKKQLLHELSNNADVVDLLLKGKKRNKKKKKKLPARQPFICEDIQAAEFGHLLDPIDDTPDTSWGDLLDDLD